MEEGKCLTPCKGIFADVQKDTNMWKLEEIKDFKNILDDYKDYKTGYNQGYSAEVGGIKRALRIFGDLFNFLGFKRQNKLRWVKIHFATPTFNLVTKDEKDNFEAKLSAIGGTLGLFTGFSVLTALEIFYFATKALISLGGKLIRKLVQKQSKVGFLKVGFTEKFNSLESFSLVQ